MSNWRGSALNHPALERFSHFQPHSVGGLVEGALVGVGLMLLAASNALD